MGWQDRDWAKFDDREFDAIYGSRPSLPSPLPRSTPSVVRRGAWPAIVLSLLAALTVGRLHLFHLPAAGGTMRTLYGQPLSDGSVCTHLKLYPGSEWKCVSALAPPQGTSAAVRVVVPPKYEGACTEVVADQSTGRWLCVGTASEPAIPS